jgi:hypothetical protein
MRRVVSDHKLAYSGGMLMARLTTEFKVFHGVVPTRLVRADRAITELFQVKHSDGRAAPPG